MGAAGTVEDAEDTAHEEGGTAHEHEGQLHGGILLAAATPHADEKVHRDEGYLIEHEHGEHVDRDEEAEHAHAEKREPKEIFLGKGLELPRREGAGENNDGGEQQHGYADAVDTDGISDMKGLEPAETAGEEHLARRIGLAGAEEVEYQIDGK